MNPTIEQVKSKTGSGITSSEEDNAENNYSDLPDTLDTPRPEPPE